MSDLDTIIINLKACLVSIKGGIPLNQVESDYFKLNGERIQFKKLGFSSLEDLINSSGKFIIIKSGGVNIVQALTDNKTQHLTDLIKRQKSKPPKKFQQNRTVPRKFSTLNSFNKPNNLSRSVNNSSSYKPEKYNQTGSIHSQTNSQRPSGSYNNSRPSYNNSRSNQFNINQPRTNDHNVYKKPQPLTNTLSINTNNYGNHKPIADACLPGAKPPRLQIFSSRLVLKTLQGINLLKDNVKSLPVANDTRPLNTNGVSYTTQEKKLPHTSSCSSLESTYSSSSASNTPKYSLMNSDKIQIENYVVSKTANQKINQHIDNDNIPLQEKSGYVKSPTQSSTKFPSVTVMPIKPSTAQSRLQKYPKKVDELLNKVDNKEKKSEPEEPLPAQFTNLRIEDSEVIDDYDYIEELESYLRNLNLSEPYYECMVKKEKNGKIIKLIHICTVKVNERSVSSSFPVECSTVENAKKIAAKHALAVLKKQYGESVIYPFTSDINIMAFRIKEFLKSGYKETGIMGDLLERLYREKFKENLPEGWVQLLEVYSYFTFDKLVANKIMIYLNEIENGHGSSNGHPKNLVDETNFIPGSPLMFEDYDEKSVLVSANYGSTSVWIRFVGQNADENFIQMQAKFNDTMNSSSISLLEDFTEGTFCAVLYNSSWHRVQIFSPPNDNGNVTCFMIDTGEQLDISKDQICSLEPMFLKPNAQAIQCILTQFDNFGTFYGLKELLDEMILNKTFFLVPDRLDEEGARVTLYEKGLSDSDRVNVNEKIMHSFLEKTLTRLPSFEENEVVDGNVSAVVESGHLYLQLKFDVVVSLEEILPNDESLTSEFFVSSKEEIDKNQIYLMKYENDSFWSRVQVHEIVNNSEAKVIYIDYGNIAICEITKLAKLYEFDPLMAMIPPQALKVSMNLLPPNKLTPDIAAKIFDITSNQKVLVNLINAPANDVPCVQLYKIEPDSDLPLCVNIQLAQSLKKQTTTT